MMMNMLTLFDISTNNRNLALVLGRPSLRVSQRAWAAATVADRARSYQRSLSNQTNNSHIISNSRANMI